MVDIRMLVACALGIVAMPVAAQETYVLDPVHSQPGFEARHIGYSLQYGAFGKVQGTVVLDRAARNGSVDITIDAASVRTFDSRLDAIVKGERFFNVEKFPTVTFKSTSVRFDGDRVAGVDGDLTMAGVTRPVSLKVANFTCGENPFNKKPMCGCDASATIKRSDWGMMAGLPAGAPSDEIVLRIPVEAYRQ
jgi:polyisoprenoid-binding protein YceI